MTEAKKMQEDDILSNNVNVMVPLASLFIQNRVQLALRLSSKELTARAATRRGSQVPSPLPRGPRAACSLSTDPDPDEQIRPRLVLHPLTLRCASHHSV